MAPECAKEHKYSAKSDVFSYGVTIYEIVTQEEPWKTMSSVQVLTQLLQGSRMPIPEKCPEVLKTVMNRFG